MADDVFKILTSEEQIRLNHTMFQDKYVGSSDDIVNQETFLQLLIAEMSNQDPLEPTSNTEFVSQLAQFSSMQYMLDSSKYAESNYASGLVGKVATATKQDGADVVTKTGIVEKVYKGVDKTKKETGYYVTIDGVDFALKNVNSVQSAPSSAASGVTGSAESLGDRIARASMMVGMFATVSGDTEGTVDAGFIDAIRSKDGKLYAVINSKSYELDKLQEVTYAVSGGNEADTDNNESTDKVDGTAAAEGSASDNEAAEKAAESGDEVGKYASPVAREDDVTETAVGASMAAETANAGRGKVELSSLDPILQELLLKMAAENGVDVEDYLWL